MHCYLSKCIVFQVDWIVIFVNQFLFSVYQKINQTINELSQVPSLTTPLLIHQQNVTQLNPLDLQDCNAYGQLVQSTKSSENSILNKLLLQSPSLKNQYSSNLKNQPSTNSKNQHSSKLSLQTNKKYEPKFAKPDVENLIQENINLKNLIQCHMQNGNQLKVKIIDLEKKIKLLEKGLEKVEKQQLDAIKQNSKLSKNKQSTRTKCLISQDTTPISQHQPLISMHKPNPTTQQIQVHMKSTTVHTQILKKKIADLTAQNTSAQKQLKFLKKLPNITIYQQNDSQKEHLMAQTIRLKSIISSLSEQTDKDQSEKFQNQFMRLMKEENEKLKATIRLLENDKILLKSRQTIQNKLNSDLKKQIQHLKTKLLYKQSQVEKINQENKNLLFKKTTQFRQEQEKKENEIIQQLRAKLQGTQNQRAKLQQNNQFFAQENMNLKEKEKNLTQEMAQIQPKHDKLVKRLNQQIQQLQFQFNNLKTDYVNLLNSGAIKKNKTLTLNNQPSGINNTSGINDTSGISNKNFTRNYHRSSSITDQNLNLTNFRSQNVREKIYSRPVKWQQVSLAMAHLYMAMQQNQLLTVEALVQNVEEAGMVRCGDLIEMFVEQPFFMGRKNAVKLASYICEEQSLSPNKKMLQNQNLTIERSLAITILNSSLRKMKQKLSPSFLTLWSSILRKSPKLSQTINQSLTGKTHLTREELCSIINANSRQKVDSEQYEYLMIRCMDTLRSEQEFVLKADKLRDFLEVLLNGKQNPS